MAWRGVALQWTVLYLLTYLVLTTTGQLNPSNGQVCGTDGMTYDNEEELRSAQSKQPDLLLLRRGSCSEATQQLQPGSVKVEDEKDDKIDKNYRNWRQPVFEPVYLVTRPENLRNQNEILFLLNDSRKRLAVSTSDRLRESDSSLLRRQKNPYEYLSTSPYQYYHAQKRSLSQHPNDQYLVSDLQPPGSHQPPQLSYQQPQFSLRKKSKFALENLPNYHAMYHPESYYNLIGSTTPPSPSLPSHSSDYHGFPNTGNLNSYSVGNPGNNFGNPYSVYSQAPDLSPGFGHQDSDVVSHHVGFNQGNNLNNDEGNGLGSEYQDSFAGDFTSSLGGTVNQEAGLSHYESGIYHQQPCSYTTPQKHGSFYSNNPTLCEQIIKNQQSNSNHYGPNLDPTPPSDGSNTGLNEGNNLGLDVENGSDSEYNESEKNNIQGSFADNINSNLGGSGNQETSFVHKPPGVYQQESGLITDGGIKQTPDHTDRPGSESNAGNIFGGNIDLEKHKNINGFINGGDVKRTTPKPDYNTYRPGYGGGGNAGTNGGNSFVDHINLGNEDNDVDYTDGSFSSDIFSDIGGEFGGNLGGSQGLHVKGNADGKVKFKYGTTFGTEGDHLGGNIGAKFSGNIGVGISGTVGGQDQKNIEGDMSKGSFWGKFGANFTGSFGGSYSGKKNKTYSARTRNLDRKLEGYLQSPNYPIIVLDESIEDDPIVNEGDNEILPCESDDKRPLCGFSEDSDETYLEK